MGSLAEGADTGIMQRADAAGMDAIRVREAGRAKVPGYWAAEDSWPSPRIKERSYFLNAEERLWAPAPSAGNRVSIPCRPSAARGRLVSVGCRRDEDLDTELPFDQRIDDADP